jgi:hypothetical protein
LSHDSLLYLYGVVPEGSPEPSGLDGLENAPVRLVRTGSLAGIVSDVPAGEYSEAALDRATSDLAWVGERGVAHDRVVLWFADRTTVVPLAPFSIHADEARVRERLESDATRFESAIQRLAGAREWGVRARSGDDLPAAVARRSERIVGLDREIAAASPGRRYLLAKRRDGEVADEVRGFASRLAERTCSELEPLARQARRLSITADRAIDAPDSLLLDLVFLVDDDRYEPFRERLSAWVVENADGLRWEFTGPWPPYHFAET